MLKLGRLSHLLRGLFRHPPPRISARLLWASSIVHEKKANKDINGTNKQLVPLRSFPPPARLPVLTRKQFVAGSTSLLQSLELNLKWLLIKQNRPFNTDDLSAFVSWFVWSNIIWFVLGTTTFVSLVVYTVKWLNLNDADDQSSFVNNLILKMLFKYDSDKIVFKFNKAKDLKDNVVPDFRKGVISIKSLSVSSPTTAHDPCVKFNLSVDNMDVTLDFSKWYQGKGLINDIDINGIRGVMENRMGDNNVEPGKKNYMKQIVPAIFKNEDYEFNSIKLQNVNIQYNSENLAAPVDFAIFNLEFPKVRLAWFLLDILKPKICSGSLNNSLFTVHQKQHNRTSTTPSTRLIDLHSLKDVAEETNKNNDSDVTYNDDSKITRVQIHAIDLKTNPLLANKFNWLVDGKVNLICDINVPSEKNFNVNELIQEIKTKVNKVNKDFLGVDLLSTSSLSDVSIAHDPDHHNQVFNFNNLFHEARFFDDFTLEEPSPSLMVLEKAILDGPQDTSVFPLEKLTFLETNKVKIKPLTKTSDNKYIFVNLKIQFVNAIAKVPESAPKSLFTHKSYISLNDLKPIIALVNNNDPSSHSFFANQNGSILTPTEISSLDNSTAAQDIPYDDTASLPLTSSRMASHDKQFTLSSTVIYNLDKLYCKVSFNETNLVDLLVSDLYEDLVKNLHYELNSRLLSSYGNYYNFNLSHLINALSKNARVLTGLDISEDSYDRLFGITNNNGISNLKLTLLILFGLGALF